MFIVKNRSEQTQAVEKENIRAARERNVREIVERMNEPSDKII